MPLDIGVGLVLGTFLHSNSEIELVVSLCIGLFAALLPDLDYLYSYIRTKKSPTTEHRDGLHYPLIVVPTVSIVGWVVSPEIGVVMGLGSLIHFIHDSVGVGFGVKWLYPFSKNSYLFLFQIETPANKEMPKQRLYSWSDTERKEMIDKYGYKDWVRFVYFRPNPWGIFEYSVFVAGLTTLVVAI